MGAPRLVFAEEAPNLMNVPDEVRKCVVFIGYQEPDGTYELMGTAFFVTRFVGKTGPSFLPTQGPGFAYLVTAKHVIDECKARNATKISVRVNFQNGEAYWIDTEDRWLFHPTEPDQVDVAVLPCTIPKNLDHISTPAGSIATRSIITDTTIGVGDEVFLTGLFIHHHGNKKNVPIVRIGNIAAMPEERVDVEGFGPIDAYLVESRSIGGLSGSPVFVHIPADRAAKLAPHIIFKPSGTVYFLLGLMHGHWEAAVQKKNAVARDLRNIETVNMGIAIVVPATKILEVLRQPMIKNHEEKVTKEKGWDRLPVRDTVPATDQPSPRTGFKMP